MFCIDANRAPASTCPEEIAYVARHLQGYSRVLSTLLKGTKCSEEECLLQGAQEKSWPVVRAWNNNDDDNPSAAASKSGKFEALACASVDVC